MPLLKANLTIDVEATVFAPYMPLTAAARYNVEAHGNAIVVTFRAAGARALIVYAGAASARRGGAIAQDTTQFGLNIAYEAGRLGWVAGTNVAMVVDAASQTLTLS